LTFFDLEQDAVEMDEICISKKQNLWLYTAVSRYSGQILAYLLSDRTYKNVKTMLKSLPKAWVRRLKYTDGYQGYAKYISACLHRSCKRFDGGTCTVEGVNNSLRHRCSFLVRRSSGPRVAQGQDKRPQRSVALLSLSRRLTFAIIAHNRAAKKRYEARLKKTTEAGE
jgi:insertion element IS1 protein InsB